MNNAERNKRICELRGVKSASLIAEEMGISRNAVIGVWNRAGLSCPEGIKPIATKPYPGREMAPVSFRRLVIRAAEREGVSRAAREWGVHRETIRRWRTVTA